MDEKESGRFWQKVEKGDECWIWTSCTTQGYPSFWLRGTTVYGHRLAYEELVGPIPPGLTIDHLCRVKRCVNPAHMEVVTRIENSRRNKGHAMTKPCQAWRDAHWQLT